MSNCNLIDTQPPLSFFDKAFSDNPNDVLFCSLNEIEPVLFENQSLIATEYNQQQIVDPRSKLPITQSLYDYTVRLKPDLFRSAHQSLLTKKEHSTCVAFIQALKAKQQIFPHQLQCFEETSAKRQKERNTFLQFLQQYNNANYEKIYAPGLLLVELYQKLYKWEAQRLMEKHHDGIFQIHTGFPIPRLCGNSEMQGAVSDVEVVSNSGAVQKMDVHIDLSKMRAKIETHLESYINRSNVNEGTSVDAIQFEISTEALVFLLCAGEYIDIPTEVLVIAVACDGGECNVQINESLPSRNAGVHTSELVASKCTEIFLQHKENEVAAEIQATGFNGTYSLQSLDTFMVAFKNDSCPDLKERSYNVAKWNLNLQNGEKQISILTQTRSGLKDGNRQIFHSLKLEYKPQFGCEIPTKVSLIREWVEQRLCTAAHSSTNRHRINASTFTTILHENLSIIDIEHQLERFYNVKIPRLLGSLSDFLGLLCKISPGRYLLRYNSRFQDKLMLYSEANDTSSKSCVTLHSLLQEEPSDMAFMTLRQLTPIDDMLCSAMHDFYQVLPCAFPPWRTHLNNKIIDDREFILRKVQEKTNIKVAQQTRMLKHRKKVKRSKKAQKLKLKTKLRKQEKEDMQELEEEINHDRVLYGFNSLEAD